MRGGKIRNIKMFCLFGIKTVRKLKLLKLGKFSCYSATEVYFMTVDSNIANYGIVKLTNRQLEYTLLNYY